MVLIQFYAAFAIATALVALIGYFIPLVHDAKQKGISNVLTESQILGAVIFFLVTFVLAPFVVSALVFPAQGELFRVGLQRVIEKSDDEHDD